VTVPIETPPGRADAERPREPSELSPPRVLQLITRDAWGGAERQMLDMVLATHPNRCEQTVSMLDEAGALTERLRAQGVPVRPLGRSLGSIGQTVRLVRVLRERRPEVVEAYGFKSGLVARAAAPLGGAPAIVIGVRGIHFTDGEVEDRRARLAQLVERLLRRTVRAYAANSHGAQRYLVGRGFPAEKFTVIRNGVATDVPRANPGETSLPRIICVARLIPRKRHVVLLRALAVLRREGLDFTCELIGAGRSTDDLQALVQELDLDESVEFSGYLRPEEIKRRLARSHLFVLSSSWEGMPGAVMEAMAAGLPVVATRVNGTDELVLDGETGYLVEVDHVDALAKRLRSLLADSELRARLGAAGARRIQGFSHERLAERKTAFYRELAQERRRRVG
jgi:glycosyltransferase involved in cell wall biosynthesis